MALNPNIILGVQPVQPVNMLGTAAQAVALKAAMQDIQGGEAMRNVFAQGGDLNDPDMQRRLMAANPKAGADIIKKQADIRKTQIDTLKDELAIRRDALSAVSTPEDYLAWHRANHSGQMGQFLSSIGVKQKSDEEVLAEITKPGGLQKAIQASALGAAKLQEKILDEQRAVKVAGISAAATMRGQNMTDARAREQMEFTRGKPIGTQVGADGVLYGIYADGSAKPIQMAGAPAPATDATAPVNNLGPTAPAAAPVNAMMAPAPNSAVAPGATPTAAPSGVFMPQAKGPMVTVQNFVPANEAAQRDFMAGAQKTHEQLKQAPTVLKNIEEAKKLVPEARMFMGTGGETMLAATKFLNNRLGMDIDTKNVKAAEELRSRLFTGILDNLKKLDSQPTKTQQDALAEALGNLGTDPNALDNVLDVFGDVLRGKVDLYNQEVIGAEKRGVKFPFDPVIKLPEKAPPKTSGGPTAPRVQTMPTIKVSPEVAEILKKYPK